MAVVGTTVVDTAVVGALLVEINDEMTAADRRYIAAASVAGLTDQPVELVPRPETFARCAILQAVDLVGSEPKSTFDMPRVTGWAGRVGALDAV